MKEKDNIEKLNICKSCGKELEEGQINCPYCGRRQDRSKFYYIKMNVINWIKAHKISLIVTSAILVVLMTVHLILLATNSPRTLTRKFFEAFNNDDISGIADCLYEEGSYARTNYILNNYEEFDRIKENLGKAKLKKYETFRRKTYVAVIGITYTMEVKQEDGSYETKEYEEVVFLRKTRGEWYFDVLPMYAYTSSITPNKK